MACRLVNLHKYPLTIDLRGGDTLVLGPGQTSRALLEELLYDNHHLPGWEAAGWVARLPAKFADALPEAGVEKKPEAEAKPEAAAKPEDEAPEEAEADDESDEDVESDAPHTKPRRRKKHR